MNTINYFNKVRPLIAVQWNGTTTEDIEEFADAIGWASWGMEIQQDNSLFLSNSMSGVQIPFGNWWVGSEWYTVADEDIQTYADQNWDVVPTNNMYSISYEQ